MLLLLFREGMMIVHTVVMIDDDKVMLRRIKKFVNFEALGMSLVGEAYDGLNGILLIEELKPDIIISDFEMPKLDGIQMMEKIRAMGIKSKLILLTGHMEFECARKAISVGAFEYMVKPILPEDLTEVMKKIKDVLDEEAGLGIEAEKRIEIIKKYIKKNLHLNMTLESVAQQTHFSSNYIRNLFKKEMGIGFKEYLIQERMKKAKYLLENTDYFVYEVVDQIGMSDVRHFTEMYKKHFGTTPKNKKK